MEYMLNYIVPIIATSFIGGITFLLKSYFSKIEGDVKSIENVISKLDGKLEQLSNDIRSNTIESVKMRTELNAVWRYIDGKKSSDCA